MIFFDGAGGFAQPCAVLVVEQRREPVVYPPVVAVEPFGFLFVEQAAVYRYHVDGAEGERFELEERAELGFETGQDELGVFYTDTVPPFFVYTRFVGYRHAGKQRGGYMVHPDLVRAFVYAEARSYAVARAVQIVDAFLPHRIACAGVELCTAASLREPGACQPDMPFQHQRVVVSFFFAHGAEGDGARDVGSAVVVLCAGVQQQQSLRPQGDVGFRCRFVMYDGGVGGISGNGVEAVTAVKFLFAAQLVQFPADAQFRFSSGFYGRFEPPQEFDQGYTVA